MSTRTKQAGEGSLAAGTIFAGYRVEGPLTRQNGAGRVYRARQVDTAEPVALKVFAAQAAARDAGWRSRFEELAQLQAELEHPNVVPILELGTNPSPFLVMTLIRGQSLPDVIDSGGMHDRRVLALLTPVAEALDFAYAHFGLVYRRLQPRSIMVAREEGRDHAYLADFGAGRPAHSTQLIESRRLGSFADYISPEEVQGAEPDLSSTVYSFATILYECLTGEPPHLYEESWEVMRAHLEERPRPLSALRPDVPTKVESVLAKGLAKEAHRRYGSPAELMEAVADAHPRAVSELGVARPAKPASATAAGGAGAAKASPGAATADAVEPQAEPRRGAARSLLRPLPIAVFVLMLVAAFAGAALSSSGEPDTVRSRSATSSALELTHRGDWRRLAKAPSLAGLPLADPIALAPPGGRAQGVLVAGRLSDTESSAGAVDRLANLGEGSKPSPVQLGEVQAFRASGQAAGFGPEYTAYLVPTTAAPVVIGCLPGAAGRVFAGRCERAASTVELRGAKALRLGVSAGYVAALDRLVSRLSSRRGRAERRLRRAPRATAQATAAAALAGTYGEASRTAGRLAPPARFGRLHDDLTAGLQRVARGYTQMRSAARRSSRVAWGRGVGVVRAGERQTRRALISLQRLIDS